MRSIRLIGVILTVAGSLGLPERLCAQSVTPSEVERAARQGEELLRNRQQIEEQRNAERDRERQRPAGASLPEQTATPGNPETGGEACLDVRQLEIVGARHLPKDAVDTIRAGAVGRCLDTRQLNDLLRSITSAYVARGLVTSRAYLPAQDTASGKLTVVVVEGTVERIEISPPGSASIASAFPGVPGEVLNLRALEQGIDQLNRLSSNNASLDIQPGSVPGSSVIVIANPARRRLMGSFGTDNTGSAATGEWLGSTTVLIDDPLRLNDGLVLSHSRSLDDPRGPAMSRSSSVAYFVPYGWLTMNLNYAESAYGSVVQGITQDFVTSGTSRTTTLRAEYVGYRDQSRKLTLYGGLTRRDNANYVAGELIETSSRRLSTFETSANLSLFQGGALWTFDLGATRGLSWLGGLVDAEGLPDTAPRAQFTKFTAGAGVNRSFETLGVRMQLSSTLNGQWSNDVLYSSEQIAIAGPFSVRGYRDGRVFGDRGFTLRNELAFPLSFPALSQARISVRPFIGADYGKVWAHDTAPGGYLSGWAAGSSLVWSRVSLQLSWSGAAWRSSGTPSDHLFFARFTAGF